MRRTCVFQDAEFATPRGQDELAAQPGQDLLFDLLFGVGLALVRALIEPFLGDGPQPLQPLADLLGCVCFSWSTQPSDSLLVRCEKQGA